MRNGTICSSYDLAPQKMCAQSDISHFPRNGLNNYEVEILLCGGSFPHAALGFAAPPSAGTPRTIAPWVAAIIAHLPYRSAFWPCCGPQQPQRAVALKGLHSNALKLPSERLMCSVGVWCTQFNVFSPSCIQLKSLRTLHHGSSSPRALGRAESSSGQCCFSWRNLGKSSL